MRFPHTFLLTEWLAARLAGRILPKKRGQDGIRMGIGEPAEDEMEHIYRELDLGSFEEVEAALGRHLGSLSGYRRNVHADLPPEARRRIAEASRAYMAEYGYDE